MSVHSKASELTLLVADDDYDFRQLLVGQLRSDGYNIVQARSGIELIDYLAGSLLFGLRYPRPSLVISDVYMPGPTGFDVLAGLKRARYPVPFVFMTAFRNTRAHARAERLGAVACLDKPFDIDKLRDLVWQLVMVPSTQKEIPKS